MKMNILKSKKHIMYLKEEKSKGINMYRHKR